jgi:transcription antitermination protein NusB
VLSAAAGDEEAVVRPRTTQFSQVRCLPEAGAADLIWNKMTRRSRAREVVLQVLYQDDLNPPTDLLASENFLRQRLNFDDALVSFARSLLLGVRRNREELDQMLTQRAENWSLNRMAVTDRNVLRLGAYEILYTDTPGRVAINEAVELAKRFGAKQSPQFVNGILDRFLQKHHKSQE